MTSLSRPHNAVRHAHEKDIADRLSRAIGQIQAVKRMLATADDHTCKEIVAQLKAARSALRKVSEVYITTQVERCNSLPEPQRTRNLKETLKALSVD